MTWLSPDWKRLAALPLCGVLLACGWELSGSPIQDSVVFYPFSGPNVLALIIFFPQKATSVMVALEPTGALPDRASIEKRGAAHIGYGFSRIPSNLLLATRTQSASR